MNVFHGGQIQRGYGLGSFFSSLARRALPFLKQGARTLGRAVLKTGVNVAQDVLAGKNLKQSARSRIGQSAQSLKEQALNQLTGQRGSGQKSLKRKKPQRSVSSRQTSKVKRAKPAKQKKPPKRKTQKKRQQNSLGKVKKSKVTHLKKDIFS